MGDAISFRVGKDESASGAWSHPDLGFACMRKPSGLTVTVNLMDSVYEGSTIVRSKR